MKEIVNFDSKVLFVLAIVLLMNGIGFCSMGIDKWLAIKQKRRIPEKTLLGISIFFGSVGSLLGMYTFHHKTKKPKFYIGIPVILGIEILGMLYFL